MTTMPEVLEFRVKERIARPPAEVFRAIVDPDVSCRYFMVSASGPVETGAAVEWRWPNGASSVVRVEAVEADARIVLRWVAQGVDYQTRVAIALTPMKEGTMVEVHETGWRPDAAGFTSSYDHCAGWQHMLLSLKAFLLHSVELRK